MAEDRHAGAHHRPDLRGALFAPSIFTAWAPASFTNLPAFRTVSSTRTPAAMNGMSPTRSARLFPRATARVWWSISSIVTGRVLG